MFQLIELTLFANSFSNATCSSFRSKGVGGGSTPALKSTRLFFVLKLMRLLSAVRSGVILLPSWLKVVSGLSWLTSSLLVDGFHLIVFLCLCSCLVGGLIADILKVSLETTINYLVAGLWFKNMTIHTVGDTAGD